MNNIRKQTHSIIYLFFILNLLSFLGESRFADALVVHAMPAEVANIHLPNHVVSHNHTDVLSEFAASGVNNMRPQQGGQVPMSRDDKKYVTKRKFTGTLLGSESAGRA